MTWIDDGEDTELYRRSIYSVAATTHKSDRNCWDITFVIGWRMLGKWVGLLSACAMQPEFVPGFFGPNKQVTVRSVSGNLFMKSTIVG